MWQFWLIASGIFFIAEIITTGFLVFWLGIAGLITMCVSFFTDNLMVQASVFVILSAVLILATKPFVKKFVNKKGHTEKTNAFSIIGKTAIVIKDIDSINGVGQIKVDGEVWSAEGMNGSNIEKGTNVIILVIAFMSIKIVKQSEVYIIERLGKFYKVADAGLTIIIPFFDHVRSVVSLKQQTMDIPPQSVITKDNVTITIDTVVFYQITDPAKAVYEIQSLKKGIEYLAITTIRDIIGKMDLDETFSSRDGINTKLRVVLDEATDRWGCKIDRVEIKDIEPPADVRDAMEKEMNAERNKRALILEAEAQRQSAITIAEGKKQAAILEAEADKESQIRRAVGEAQAIKEVADAKAKEIQMVYDAIKKSDPDEKLVQLKSLEALEKVAEGEANKVFIPFEATSALGSLGAIKEVMTDDKKVKPTKKVEE